MITERTFASQFNNFWRASLPNLEAVLRTLNLAYDRVEIPYKSATDPRRRDLISETGFRLFGLVLDGHRISEATIETAGQLSGAFLHASPTRFSAAETTEISEISRRLRRYTAGLSGPVAFAPPLKGHGMLSPCFADIVVGEQVVEVKYVDRTFRSTDLRQALCYASLRYLAEGNTFSSASIFNPLRGTAISIGISELISGASGRSAEEFFQDFSYVLSSGEISR